MEMIGKLNSKEFRSNDKSFKKWSGKLVETKYIKISHLLKSKQNLWKLYYSRNKKIKTK